MTKFDKQMEDSRTGSKANNFFREFISNKCVPHLVMTPTLEKEELPPKELFEKRQALMASAEDFEAERFTNWLDGHAQFLQVDATDELLDEKIKTKIGFRSAETVMRKIMLEHTARQIPIVLQSLRRQLELSEKAATILKQKAKLHDPAELKALVIELLWHMQKRIESYLDGNLESSLKFPERLQSLDDEVEEEDESEWSNRELNHYTKEEEDWRNRIVDINFPSEIQPGKKFIGGKQVQRAFEFFRFVMIGKDMTSIVLSRVKWLHDTQMHLLNVLYLFTFSLDSLPDPYDLEEFVPNATGYGIGGLHHENWERALVQIVKVSVKSISHPGINYLIKHVGCIFRRLFSIALDDVREGEEMSAKFELIPDSVDKFLRHHFDAMLWALMQSAADKTHCALEPMYSSIDPNLPTFHSSKMNESADEDNIQTRISNFVSQSADAAKTWLKDKSTKCANETKSFLPDDRTSMITDKEVKQIIARSFEYIVALMEFNLFTLKFQLNHYLIIAFKEKMSRSFISDLADQADWDKLIMKDPELERNLYEIEQKISGLTDSLRDVQKMYRGF